MPYFEGHNAISLFSFYYEDELLMNLKKGTTVQDKRVIGVMTTRPLNVIINKGRSQIKLDVYYVDHLCVDKMYRKKGIAPQIIQTHHFNQRHNNKKIKISLFKREDNLTGIVPLCVYNTYGFDMTLWKKPIEFMPNIASLIECGKTNIHHLFDFMRENTSRKFEIFIQPEISNILELIKTKNIFIYMMICDGEVKSAYFYRKSCTFIRDGCQAISCFASIDCFSKKNAHLFVQGFKISLWKIANKNNFKFLTIEDISDNNKLIDNLKLKSKPMIVSPTAYFFYNYAYHTLSSNNLFIFN
jgi:GNAT superfamily N-acetyltransferase